MASLCLNRKHPPFDRTVQRLRRVVDRIDADIDAHVTRWAFIRGILFTIGIQLMVIALWGIVKVVSHV